MNGRSVGADCATMLQLTQQAAAAGLHAPFIVDASGRPLAAATRDLNRLAMTPAHAAAAAVTNGKAASATKQKHHPPATPANPASVWRPDVSHIYSSQ